MSVEIPYDRLLVVRNPNSGQSIVSGSSGGFPGDSEKFSAFLGEVAKLPIDYEVMDTCEDPAQTKFALKREVQSGDAVVVFAGDGGYSQVARGMAELELPNVCVPLSGGTKNNTARAYNGSKSLRDILEHGQVASVALLETSWVTPSQETHAVHSVDDSALMAPVSAIRRVTEKKPINRQRNKAARWLSEVFTTLSAIADHPPMTVQFDGLEEEQLASLIFGHNYYLAGDGRMHVTAFEDRYEMLKTPPEGLAKTAWRMGKLACGRLYGDINDAPTTFTVSSKNDAPIPLQVDGDHIINRQALAIEPGSSVTAGLAANKQFNTLATRFMKPRTAE
jgi:diacylglycerol kinase family enzyme